MYAIGKKEINDISSMDAKRLDERIACEYILNKSSDVIINIIDASNLERNLYLTMQLLEMRMPMIIAMNMMDVARKRSIKIFLVSQ